MNTSSKLNQSQTKDSNSSHDRMSLISDYSDREIGQNLNELSRSASLYDPNASILSEESFVGDSFEDSTGGPHFNGSLTVQNAKFAEKANWEKNPDCKVCKRKMDRIKGINRHHCRICAYGVCGLCSKNKVNGSRVCDLCFFKQKTEFHEKRREEYLTSRQERLSQAETILHNKTEELKNTKSKLSNVSEEIELAQEEHLKGISNLEKIRDEVKSVHLEKKQEVEHLRQKIEKTKREARDREEKLRNVKTKISVLKLQLNQKKAMIDNKKEEFENLKQTKEALEYRSQRAQGNGSIAEDGSKISFVSRNYSLLNQEKNGKYNISLQPVNI